MESAFEPVPDQINSILTPQQQQQWSQSVGQRYNFSPNAYFGQRNAVRGNVGTGSVSPADAGSRSSAVGPDTTGAATGTTGQTEITGGGNQGLRGTASDPNPRNGNGAQPLNSGNQGQGSSGTQSTGSPGSGGAGTSGTQGSASGSGASGGTSGGSSR